MMCPPLENVREDDQCEAGRRYPCAYKGER